MTAKRKHSPLTNALPTLAPILAALVTLLGVLVLVGWGINYLLIARINTKFIPMSPATALCFVLLGAVLLLRQGRSNHRTLRHVWQVLAGIVLLFNISLLIQLALTSLFNLPLDIEQWFVTASMSEQGYVIGRMSPLTALMFILLSSAVLLSLPARDVNHARDRVAQSAAVVTLLLAAILVVGYWYGAPLLYGGMITPVALTTAIGFILLSGGFLFEGTNALFSHWVMSTSVFSRFTRRVLPATVGIILLFGWFHIGYIEKWDPTYHTLLLALSAFFTAGFVVLLTMTTARQIQNVVTHAEKELRESEEKFRGLFENSHEALMVIEAPSWRFTSANPTCLKMFGAKNEDDFISHTPWELSSDRQPDGQESAEKAREMIEKAVREGYNFFEWTHRRIGGDEFPTDVLLVRIEQGGKDVLQATVRDITERKRAEEALRASQQIIEGIINSIPVRVFWKDKNLVYLGCNVEFAHDAGFADPKDIIGKDDYQMGWRDQAELYRSADRQVIESGSSKLLIEEPQTTPEGNVITLLTSKIPLRSPEGEIIGVLGTYMDITERKRVEDVLYKQQQIFRTLVENSPDIIARYDRDCQRTYVNPMYQKVAQVSQQELIATSPIQRSPLPAASALVLQNLLRKVLDSGVAEAVDVIWPKADKTDHWYNIYASPEFDREGRVVSVMTVSRDITGRKRAEEEIGQLNAELEQRVEERTRALEDAQEQLVRQEKLAVLGQLAGGVGHELRNPLAVINNAIYFLKLVQPDADEKVKSYHRMIEHETHTAEKIINDLLDFARIKSVDREPVAVSELVQRVLDRYLPPKTITTALKLPKRLPLVYVDPRQMEQVLGNLVVNAYQAMPGGGKLTISASKREGMVTIAVKDTGVGIPPENMKKLFEPLFTTKIKGIGLGLAVSRKLAEANSGCIEVRSEPEKGSTFSVSLPIQSNVLIGDSS